MFAVLLLACTPTALEDDSGPAGTGDDSAAPVVWPALFINEFMASNRSTLQDGTGAWPDWVELYNPGDVDVDLDGWTMTDTLEDPDQHRLEALTVPAAGFLVLFADSDPEEGPDHLDFSLASEGEALGLFAPDGQPLQQIRFDTQVTDHSAARETDGGELWVITDAPTPGGSNTP
ncbi:MAG: lamin tail domain-containing protein [Alphaproteobacteria bacterium]|nr:lamin tail domain-containing protein [Alphaproteobacteria bacterium]